MSINSVSTFWPPNEYNPNIHFQFSYLAPPTPEKIRLKIHTDESEKTEPKK